MQSAMPIVQGMRRFFHACFFALMIGICLGKCAYLFELLPLVIACGGVILLVILFLVMMKYWDKLTTHISQLLDIIENRVSPGKMLGFLILFSLLTKIGAAVILDINSLIHPDIEVYVTTAKELADNYLAQTYAEYCYSFSHMFWFSVFLMPVVKLFGISYTMLTVYMVVISTISTALLFNTIKYVFSYKKAIVFAAVYCMLPSQMLLSGYIVHEQALMFFLSVAVLLYYRILPSMKKKVMRALVFAGALQSLVFAIQVNSLGIIAIIAFGFELLCKVSLKNIKKLVLLLIVLIAVVVESVMFNQIQLRHSSLEDEYFKSNKVKWTLYVGANIQTKGTWSSQDADTFAQYHSASTDSEIEAYQSELLRERYISLIKNWRELFELLRSKFLTIWACFTYPIGYSNETITSPEMRTVYNRFLFKPLVMLEFGASVIFAFCGLISRIKCRTKDNGFQLFLELYMLGVTAMLLLTECSNKYTISLQPIFLIACLSAIAFLKNKKNDASETHYN